MTTTTESPSQAGDVGIFFTQLAIVVVLTTIIYGIGWAIEEYLIADSGFFIWIGAVSLVLLIASSVMGWLERR